ncbi:hypothetical protein GEMRC1_010495 [Eukaryota sp. GEM-RC1]
MTSKLVHSVSLYTCLSLITTSLCRLGLSKLCFRYLFGSRSGIKQHLSSSHLSPYFFFSVVQALSVWILFLGSLHFLYFLLSHLRKPNKVLTVFFFTVFYTSLLLILVLPSADLILNVTAGQKLTPGTIKAYSSSKSSNSFVDAFLDGFFVAKSLAPIEFRNVLLVLSFALLLVVSVQLYCVYKSKKGQPSGRYFKILVVLFILSLLVTVSPWAITHRTSTVPVHLSTKVTDLYFFFKPPVYPIEEYMTDMKLIREMFPLPSGRYWLSENYPLVHGNIQKFCQFNSDHSRCLKYVIPEKQSHKEPPDIFFNSVGVVVW